MGSGMGGMGGMGGGMGGLGGGGMPGPAFSSRLKSKASKIYDNRARDLVDAVQADKDAITKVDAEKLPEEMQKMTAEQRKKHVADKAAARKKIQDEIKKITAERDAFVLAQRKKMGQKKDTFGDAIVDAIDHQLEVQGFQKSGK